MGYLENQTTSNPSSSTELRVDNEVPTSEYSTIALDFAVIIMTGTKTVSTSYNLPTGG